MLFGDVLCNESVKQRLKDMVQQNRLSHAIILLGGEGNGALPLALAFTQYIACEKVQRGMQPKADLGPSLFGDALPPAEPKFYSEPCNECSSCIKAKQFIHPDIHFTYPIIPKKSGDKPKSTDYVSDWRGFIQAMPYGNAYDWLQYINAENKQGNISAEECNEINRQMSLQSFENNYKILILWMPEYLGKEGNKLLKLIEEPPPNTIFILVAEKEDLILPTILSRCLLVKVNAAKTDQIKETLMLKAKATAAQAHQAAIMAHGNYRAALEILQHNHTDNLSLVKEWMNAIFFQGPAAQVKWCDDMSRLGRENQKQFLLYFLQLIEASTRMLAGVPSNDQADEQEAIFIAKLHKMCGQAGLIALATQINNAIYHIERNANAKMLFHALCIKFWHLIKNKMLLLTD